jgi:hypothetical protein
LMQSRSSRATTRCPVWMGLNVPPKMPILIWKNGV